MFLNWWYGKIRKSIFENILLCYKLFGLKWLVKSGLFIEFVSC